MIRFLRWLFDRRGGPTPTPGPRPTPPPPPIPSGGGDSPSRPHDNGIPRAAIGIATVTAINTERDRSGLSVLAYGPALAAEADGWARGMARRGAIGHEGFADRIARAAPNCAGGECVAYTWVDTPAAAVASWMGSPPHRAILLGDFDACGSGRAKGADGAVYWCAIAAKVNG